MFTITGICRSLFSTPSIYLQKFVYNPYPLTHKPDRIFLENLNTCIWFLRITNFLRRTFKCPSQIKCCFIFLMSWCKTKSWKNRNTAKNGILCTSLLLSSNVTNKIHVLLVIYFFTYYKMKFGKDLQRHNLGNVSYF